MVAEFRVVGAGRFADFDKSFSDFLEWETVDHLRRVLYRKLFENKSLLINPSLLIMMFRYLMKGPCTVYQLMAQLTFQASALKKKLLYECALSVGLFFRFWESRTSFSLSSSPLAPHRHFSTSFFFRKFLDWFKNAQRIKLTRPCKTSSPCPWVLY